MIHGVGSHDLGRVMAEQDRTGAGEIQALAGALVTCGSSDRWPARIRYQGTGQGVPRARPGAPERDRGYRG